jgi:hypothetical protein
MKKMLLQDSSPFFHFITTSDIIKLHSVVTWPYGPGIQLRM